MRIKLIGDNLELTQDHYQLVRDKVKKRLEKLLKTFNTDMTVADLRIKVRSRWGYKVSFSMVLPGKKQIYADHVSNNLSTALREMCSKVRQQIKTYRGKLGITNKTKRV